MAYISYDYYYNNNKLNTLCKLNCEKCAFGTFRIDPAIERLKFDRSNSFRNLALGSMYLLRDTLNDKRTRKYIL